MKRILYTLMVLCAFGLFSCRKASLDISLKQYDQQQIESYMAANGLTSVMKRDTAGGDTTGIYYQIIKQGTGAAIKYSDKIAFTYTERTFDGNYVAADTILNHSHAYTAYIGPNGLQLALINILKNKGGQMRVLIPSHLAYGGSGTSFTHTIDYTGATTTGYIAGNQCLDFTVTLIDDHVIAVNNTLVNTQSYYDDLSIQKYLAANGLTQYYHKLPAGTYYRIIQAGTGTDPITINSTLGVQYTGYLLNGTAFDQAVTTDGTAATSFTLNQNIPAWQQALPYVTAGAQLGIICPSAQAYGQDSNSGSAFTIPAFSCLHFEITVVSVSN
jgi:FKBP-type peptidyl-prolyl cis-trans isomerase